MDVCSSGGVMKVGDLVWVEGMGGQARIMAISGRYVILRFPRCYPFVKDIREIYTQLDSSTPKEPTQ